MYCMVKGMACLFMREYKDDRIYLKELGEKIKLHRVSMKLTQMDLEAKSGVSKRSISRLEQGESVQLDNFIKIMMALNLGENIDMLIPDQTKRPSYYLEKSEDKPKRVRKKTEKKSSRKQK